MFRWVETRRTPAASPSSVNPAVRRAAAGVPEVATASKYAQEHRSVIVNLRRVSRVSRGPNETAEVHLEGRTEVLPVSRSFVHLFRQM